MCAEEWNSNYSDLVCKTLGYASSAYTDFIPSQNIENGSYFYKLKMQEGSTRLLSMLEKLDACEKVISISCQEFSKFSFKNHGKVYIFLIC